MMDSINLRLYLPTMSGMTTVTKPLFCMYYCDKNGTVHEIGAVKIYYIENDIDRKRDDKQNCSLRYSAFIATDSYLSLSV